MVLAVALALYYNATVAPRVLVGER
jgi:hypothetical protein